MQLQLFMEAFLLGLTQDPLCVSLTAESDSCYYVTALG